MKALSLYLGLLCATLLQAAPLRLVLPRVVDSRALTPGDDVSPLVTLYLRDRIAECADIEVVSDARAGAILGGLTRSQRPGAGDNLVTSFSTHLPVNAIVHVLYRDKALSVTLHLADGPKPISCADLRPGRLQEGVRRIAADIGAALRLSPADMAVLTEQRFPNDAVFRVFHLSRIISKPYPLNPAQYRLEMLRPVFDKNPTNIHLAARIAEDAAYLLSARKRDQIFAKDALRMAGQVLPLVLGTSLEKSTYAIAAQIKLLNCNSGVV